MTSSVGDMLVTIIAIFVLVVFVWSIYTFLYGVVQFIFSGGSEDKIKTVFFKVRYAILGIIFTLLFLFTLPVILNRMGIPEYRDYTARNIFNRVADIVQWVLNFGIEADRVNY